jgi:hypothetical protein
MVIEIRKVSFMIGVVKNRERLWRGKSIVNLRV